MFRKDTGLEVGRLVSNLWGMSGEWEVVFKKVWYSLKSQKFEMKARRQYVNWMDGLTLITSHLPPQCTLLNQVHL